MAIKAKSLKTSNAPTQDADKAPVHGLTLTVEAGEAVISGMITDGALVRESGSGKSLTLATCYYRHKLDSECPIITLQTPITLPDGTRCYRIAVTSASATINGQPLAD